MSTKTNIFLPLEKENKLIEFKDILFVEASNKSTKLCLDCSEEMLLVKQNLKFIEEEFPQDSFYKAHRSFVVNRSHIEGFCSEFKCIKLANHHSIPLAKSRKKDFLAWFNSRSS